jgi:Cache domain.
LAIVVFIVMNFSNITTKMANDQIEASSYRYANSIKGDFDRSFSSVASLSSAMSVEAGSQTASRVDSTAVLTRALQDNRDFFGLWMCFEPNTFDGKDAEFVNKQAEGDARGRYVPYVFRGSNGSATQSESLVGYDVPGDGDYYLKARDSGRFNITTPFYYTAGGKTIFVTSAAVPIKKNDKVLGAIGGDLVVDDIAARVLGIKMYQTGYAYLLDHNGIVVSHPNKDLVLKPISPPRCAPPTRTARRKSWKVRPGSPESRVLSPFAPWRYPTPAANGAWSFPRRRTKSWPR